jgi:putative transposase
LEAAREWVANFVVWYNTVHLHSGLRFVTPNDRHQGHDKDILTARHEVYLEARQKRPERWSKTTRNWSVVGEVRLNPKDHKEAPKQNIR